jgi:hypothetical protein
VGTGRSTTEEKNVRQPAKHLAYVTDSFLLLQEKNPQNLRQLTYKDEGAISAHSFGGLIP